MGLDSVEEYNGYDEVDSGQAFGGGGSGRNGMGGGGRRRGKKPLSSSSTYRSRSKRTMRGGFSFSWLSLNLRGFEDTAKAVLAVSVGALALCAVILYATFGMHILPAFYGSLAASIVVMVLLFYTASKLIGNN